MAPRGMLQLPRASQRLPESSGLRWQPTKPDVRPHTAGRWRQTAGRSCHPAQPASSAAVHSADPALISEVACQARSSPGGDLGLAFQALLHKFGSKGPSAQPYGARVVVDAMSYQPPGQPEHLPEVGFVSAAVKDGCWVQEDDLYMQLPS